MPNVNRRGINRRESLYYKDLRLMPFNSRRYEQCFPTVIMSFFNRGAHLMSAAFRVPGNEHDDRVPLPQDGTRRVSFKNHGSGRQKNNFKKAWDNKLKGFLDDDVDMTSNVQANERARTFHNKHRHAGERFKVRHLNESPTSWYKIIIRNGNKYAKDYLLKLLSNFIQPHPFFPMGYKNGKDESSFCVGDYETASQLNNADRKITAQDGWKLMIRVRPFTPMIEVDPKLSAAMKTAMASRYNPAVKALNLKKFHADEALVAADLFVPLNRPNLMMAALDIIAESIPDLVALDIGDNKLSQIEHMKIMIEKCPNLKVLHIGDNRLRDIKQLDVLKGLQLEELVLDGNTLCNKFTSQEIYIRHLATGESFRSLAFQYRVSHSWISVIIREVAEAIIKRMLDLIIPSPTEDHLLKISSQFFSKWNYPNCVGAIDGKHIRIKAPKNSGSLYYNYKEYYSIVLLAVVDAECKFTAIDVGSYGREGDAGIYLKSKIGKQIKNNTFNIPAPKSLPGTDAIVPHVIVGDEAFSLHENLMKPFPRQQSLHDPSKAVYNYRLSRARRTTENTFGILSGYFRLFYLPIATNPETTDKLIICACILYNILREAKVLAPGQTHVDDTLPLPTNNLIPMAQNNIRATMNQVQIRETFKNYFNGPGAIEWQHKYAVQH